MIRLWKFTIVDAGFIRLSGSQGGAVNTSLPFDLVRQGRVQLRTREVDRPSASCISAAGLSLAEICKSFPLAVRTRCRDHTHPRSSER